MLRSLARRLLAGLLPPTGPLSTTPVSVAIAPVSWPAGPTRALWDEALRGGAWRRAAQELLAGVAASGVSHDNALEIIDALYTVARTAAATPGAPSALVHELAGLCEQALVPALDRLPFDAPPQALRACLQVMNIALLLPDLPAGPRALARAEARAVRLVDQAIGGDGLRTDGRLDGLVELVELSMMAATTGARRGRGLDVKLSDAAGRAAVVLGTLAAPTGHPPAALADPVDGRAAALAAAALYRGWSIGPQPPGADPQWCAAWGIPTPAVSLPHTNDWALTSFRAQGLVYAFRHARKGPAVALVEAGCAQAHGTPPTLAMEILGQPLLAPGQPRLFIGGQAARITPETLLLETARVDGPAASTQLRVSGWPGVTAVHRLLLRQARASWSTRLETDAAIDLAWHWQLAPGWRLAGEHNRLEATHTSGLTVALALDARLEWTRSGETRLEGQGRVEPGSSALTARFEWT